MPALSQGDPLPPRTSVAVAGSGLCFVDIALWLVPRVGASGAIVAGALLVGGVGAIGIGLRQLLAHFRRSRSNGRGAW